MRAENRAENPVIPTEGRSTGISILPRELRTPIFGARLLLATLGSLSGLSGAQVVEGAGKDCRNTQILVVGVGYVNNPLEPNRPKQADPADLVVGSPEFGVVVVERLDNPEDPKSKRTTLSRNNLVNKGSYTSATIKLEGLSNTRKNNNEAMEVAYFFENDPEQKNPLTNQIEKPRVSAVISCGATLPVWGGRSAPLSEIERALNNGGYEFRTVASVVNEAMKNVTGQSANLGPDKVSQIEVRRALKAYIDKERAITITPTVTGTPTPANTRTPEASLTPTVIRASETSTPTVPATISPTPTPASEIDRLQAQIAEKRQGIFKEATVTTLQSTLASLNDPSLKQRLAVALGTPTTPSQKSADESTFMLTGLLEGAKSVTDLPVRGGIDIAGWLLALGVGVGVAFDRPRTRLQAIRLNHPRTRLWNSVAVPFREIGYRRGPLRAHRVGLATGAILAGTPPPARVYAGVWSA